MKIKAILFEKNGNFSKVSNTWISTIRYVIKDILDKYNIIGDEVLIKELLLDIGIFEENFDKKIIYSKFSITECSNIWYETLGSLTGIKKDKFREFVQERFDFYNLHKEINIKTATEIYEALEDLRAKGFLLGILTEEPREAVNFFLKKEGLNKYFDFIESTKEVKSYSNLIKKFCLKFSLNIKDILVISDSIYYLEKKTSNNFFKIKYKYKNIKEINYFISLFKTYFI